MSDKKYTTFRDLRSVPTPQPVPATTSIPSTPSTPSTLASTTSKSRTPSTRAIAPERDFQRVPNSVTRQAIPQGLFKGKSKQVWDYLYSVTRGAIVPKRSARKSRKEIKAGSGLGSMVTVDAAIEHLTSVGLLSVQPSIGSLMGNEYEVFTPEEAASSLPSTSSTSSTPRISRITQNLDNLDTLESSSTRQTQTVESTTTSAPHKTFLSDKERSDDEHPLVRALKQTEKEVTGKNASADTWQGLAELLSAEFKIAAARTTVSNGGAFLTEHLRRRLWKKDKAQLDRETREAATEPESKWEIAASKCPDCGGSGWWYPEGPERGVAKCKHANAKATEVAVTQNE